MMNVSFHNMLLSSKTKDLCMPFPDDAKHNPSPDTLHSFHT